MGHRPGVTTTVGVIGGIFTSWAGNQIIEAMFAAACADIVTGFAKALVLHQVESHRMGKGLYRILTYLAIGTGLLLIGKTSTEALVMTNALAGAFLFRELTSNVENLAVIGLAIGVEIPGIPPLVRLLRLNEGKLAAEAGSGKPAPLISGFTPDTSSN